MASIESWSVVLAIVYSGISFASAEYCYAQKGYVDVYGTYKYKTSSTYCYSDQYCCAGTYYTSCCSYTYSYYDYGYYYVMSAGTIAGAVVGGLVGLGVLISIIVCLVCVCARNRTQRPGQVIANPGQTTTFTVASHNASHPGTFQIQSTYPQNVQNSQYPQYLQYPGGYNPAYTPDGQQTEAANPTATAPPPYDTVANTNSTSHPPPPVGFTE